jgi:hypothetical protein
MGVRLYPNTTDTVKLERLAQVPPGTKASLDRLEKKRQKAVVETNFEEGSRAFYDTLQDGEHEHENTLHNFLIFGWGKFRNLLLDDYNTRVQEFDPNVGRVDYPFAGLLLKANNIFGPHPDGDWEIRGFDNPSSITGRKLAEYCEGVHWC